VRQQRRATANTSLRTPDSQIGNKVIVIHGNSGSGKSTFLASFSDLYRKTISNSTHFLVFHTCRGSPTAFNFALTLLRIGTELLKAFPNKFDKFELQPPCGYFLNTVNVVKWWHNLLCQASEAAMLQHVRPVIVIDDFFESDVSSSNWEMLLPSKYRMRSPPGITIVISTDNSNHNWRLVQSKSSIDQSFQYRSIPINPLFLSEQESLIENHFMQYGLQPSKEIVADILRKNNAQHPAYLRALCEDLMRNISLSGSSSMETFPDSFHGENNPVVNYLQKFETEFGIEPCAWVLSGLAYAGFMDLTQISQLLEKCNIQLDREEHLRFSALLGPLVVQNPVRKGKYVGKKRLKRGSISSARRSSATKRNSMSKRSSLALANVGTVLDQVMHLKNTWACETIIERYVHVKQQVESDVLHRYLFEIGVSSIGDGKIPIHLIYHVSCLCRYARESRRPNELMRILLSKDLLNDWIKSIVWHDPIEYIMTQLRQFDANETFSSEIKEISSFLKPRRADIKNDLDVLDEFFSKEI